MDVLMDRNATHRETWRAGLVKRNSSRRATGSQNSPLSPPLCLVLRDLARGWKSRIFAGYLQAAHVGLFLHRRCSEKNVLFSASKFHFLEPVLVIHLVCRRRLRNRTAAASTPQYTRHKILLREQQAGSSFTSPQFQFSSLKAHALPKK